MPYAVENRDSGFKAINYNNVFALLVEAIKEQQDQIDEMKNEINELKNK